LIKDFKAEPAFCCACVAKYKEWEERKKLFGGEIFVTLCSCLCGICYSQRASGLSQRSIVHSRSVQNYQEPFRFSFCLTAIFILLPEN
jgi:hypothetical protein